MNPRRIGADFRVFALGFLRNSVSLFFSLFFPLVLIVMFGAIYGGLGTAHATLWVEDEDSAAPLAQAFLKTLNATGDLTLNFVSPSVGNLSTYLTNHSLTAGLVIPATFSQQIQAGMPANLTLYTDPVSSGNAGVVQGAVGAALFAFNLQLAHGTVLAGVSQHNVGSPVFTNIDYLVPGLIGFSILVSPMFAMVDLTATYRKEKLFRQLALTPLTKGEWLTSKIVWYVGLTFVSAALMIGAGDGIFGAHATLSWGMLPFLVLGPFFFVSLGMLAGSLTRTPETAAIVGNVISFPMMFLSGTFFPVSAFGSTLQTIAKVLPLYYVIDGLNAVMLFNNPVEALHDALIVAGLSVIVFGLALLAFKWRDE
ncbi:MAG: ABC transporter permease [Thermoplasmata archaeon]